MIENNIDDSLNFVCEDLSTIFTCPACKQANLKFVGDNDSSDRSNSQLECDHCNTVFAITDGIPRLVELDNYSESFGYQWNIHSKTQLDSHSGLSISDKRLFDATGWAKKSMQGQRVLEAGSGAGRFTEVLVGTEADIYSFDFSRAVDANARNNGSAKNLTLFQGDIFNIPFPDDHFDHVICLGVIQHTPDPEAAFMSLAKKVKPGGSLNIDVYTQSWYHYLHWKYILRPITMKMDREQLYRLISRVTPYFVPPARMLRKLFGRAGARLVPIVEFSYLGLDSELNKEWAILDTFDMYSPAHDHPQSMKTVKRWFSEGGFENVKVWYGANGVVGRGYRSL
ncbi:MAG: methyltransferase domain-containing protein [Desulfobulbaceae bacterium]|nr:methyltransferase domain-containing protein [Desulfobulbaceae bacterium]